MNKSFVNTFVLLSHERKRRDTCTLRVPLPGDITSEVSEVNPNPSPELLLSINIIINISPYMTFSPYVTTDGTH